ncbi:23354_t:CDS:1, partial [Dentiscutata erythropus]
ILSKKMDLIHTSVSSIFLKTHSEIFSLEKSLINSKRYIKQITITNWNLKKESPLESVEFDNIQDKEPQQLDNQILTPFQLENFQKIFAQHTIKESDEEQEINEQLTILLDQQEKDAFF